jgi:hypothetical protein
MQFMNDDGNASNDLRRVAFASALTWGGLMLLASAQDRLIGPSPSESALFDVAVHARYLVALPLLLACPKVIEARLIESLEQFTRLDLVHESHRPAFEAAVDRTLSRRNSWAAYLACAGLSVIWVLFYANNFLSQVFPEIGANWHFVLIDGQLKISAAGWWYLLICQPLYAFVILTTAYRAGLLWLLFFRISTLKLKLNALHGDQAAGLGFLANLLRPLRNPAFAISTSAAGTLADLMIFGGGDFVNFLPAVGTFVIVVCLLLAGPLMLFSDTIRGARRVALLRQGEIVAGRATEALEATSDAPFEAVSHTRKLNEENELLQRAKNTRPLIQRAEFAKLVGVSLLPFAAVATLQLPLNEIVTHIRFFLL